MSRPPYIPRVVRPCPTALLTLLVAAFAGTPGSSLATASETTVDFSRDVLPIFQRHCFECHAHENAIKGGLALDSPSGLRQGGEGGPIFVPGDPESSRLITAVRHVDQSFKMPPKSKLSQADINTLAAWITEGAHDPRATSVAPTPSSEAENWEQRYEERLGWWSLQPVNKPEFPKVETDAWPRNNIDRFILAALESKELEPAPPADPRTLVRRLSFALTGLPPKPEIVETFATNPTPEAYAALVDRYLASPHYGERWARHWMDVVHYTDTHGYEWDTPAKNAWRYRDYLIRAYNDDVSFKQLILEQIAGDQLPPRIDPKTQRNESLIGPMAMRLGERRHGDNAQTEGVTQEAVANMVDTLSKGFLATTVACAQCHDHKLDAVAQQDYYGLAGTLMSSRWTARPIETTDPNGPVIDELRDIKHQLRRQLYDGWHPAAANLAATLLNTPVETTKVSSEKDRKKEQAEKPPIPDSALVLWQQITTAISNGRPFNESWEELRTTVNSVNAVRANNNRKNRTLFADFTQADLPHGWRAEGLGMKYGLADNGALVIAEEGEAVVDQLLPAGRWSHLWSKRLEGSVRSALFSQDPPPTISVEYAGGDFAAQSLIVDNAFHSERMQFLKKPRPSWLTFTAGNLAALAGGPDSTPRQVYLEFVTKSLNNYYPPRDKYGGLPREGEEDPRPWFGVIRAWRTTPGYTPEDELDQLVVLVNSDAPIESLEALAHRFAAVLSNTIERWNQNASDASDVRLINEALDAGWLPNTTAGQPKLAALVRHYRDTESRLQPSRTVGSVDDWQEGQDARLAVRGSYTTLGDPVPRGTIRFLGGPGARAYTGASGRLELARSIAADDNPLTARVYVNRIWHHLFGAGIVRTVDDFGHLGEQPSHPELLDHLTRRFIEQDWSTKALVRDMVLSVTWQQGSAATPEARTADPENRLLHHYPLRRLDAESIRDAMLATSGALDPSQFGPPINPYRVAEDPTKRLYSGPLDGNGRRSIYQKMTLMEPPKFLALFNQPIPKLTTGKRDTTNVPNQALALLNDPFVLAMAKAWSENVTAAETPESRASAMFQQALGRPPVPEETQRLVTLAKTCAELRGIDPETLLDCPPVWQDVAHAIFNLKEFIYLR